MVSLFAPDLTSEQVQGLLEAGADVNAKSKNNCGYTPLHMACERGHEQIVRLLIANGAKVNVKSMRGWTPLHWSCYEGYEPIKSILISYGADVKWKDLFEKYKEELMTIARSNKICKTSGAKHRLTLVRRQFLKRTGTK